MLSVHNVSKSFGNIAVLNNISFNLNAGERLGLIGPNGCGKTTLIRILAGLDQPDTGGVGTCPPDLRIGYLPQGDAFQPDETIQSFLNRMVGSVNVLAERLAVLAAELTSDLTRINLQREYDLVLTNLEAASQSAGRSPTVLAALGLADYPMETSVSILSGGQKTRLAMAGVLLSNPQLLLLDEPTNHLDIQMLDWLEGWLNSFSQAALIVSHDRAFLDRTVTGILELDPKTQTIKPYAGSYSDYAARKAAEHEKHWQQYKDQQDEIARIQRAARLMRDQAQFKKGGKADQRFRFAKGFYGERSLEKMRTAKRYEKRLSLLTGEGAVAKPKAGWQVKIDFAELPETGKDVLSVEQLAIGYGLPLLKDINLHVQQGQRIALIGPNGCGKTTLLKVILGKLSPLAGRIRLGRSVRVGYMAQEQETLDPELDVLTTLRREAALSETDARSYLHKYLFSGDEVFRKVKHLSYGERSLLMLSLLVA